MRDYSFLFGVNLYVVPQYTIFLTVYKRLQTFTNEFKHLFTEYHLDAVSSLPCRNIRTR